MKFTIQLLSGPETDPGFSSGLISGTQQPHVASGCRGGQRNRLVVLLQKVLVDDVVSASNRLRMS